MKTRGFAHRIDIEAPPPVVWTALWSDARAAVAGQGCLHPSLQKGGTWSATIAPGLLREGIIDVFDPPRRLRLIYMTPPDLPTFEGAVVDDVMLEATEGQSVVRLLVLGRAGFSEWTPHYMKARTAAERALARLKVLVEQRERMTAAKSPAS